MIGTPEYLAKRVQPDSSFDVALALAFVKHSSTPAQFLIDAYRVLRPGDVLILLDPGSWVVQLGFCVGKFEKLDNPDI